MYISAVGRPRGFEGFDHSLVSRVETSGGVLGRTVVYFAYFDTTETKPVVCSCMPKMD